MEADCEMLRALTIPEILEHILQFCSGRDLLSCRLVSKDWRDSSAKAWNSKARIILDDDMKMSGFLDFLKSEHAPRKPFVHFSVGFSLRAEKTAARFWGICGENVKSLELNRCVFRSADDLRAVLFQLCPNMEKLSIDEISVSVNVMLDQRRRWRPEVEAVAWTEPKFGEHRKLKNLTVDHRASKATGICWMEYFSHFSSIEVLTMQREHFGDPDMFRAVARIREQNPTKLKFKQIRICFRSRHLAPSPAGDLLGVLLDPGLQLESLVICVNRSLAQDMQAAAPFRDILNAHRASLKTLGLNCRFRDSDIRDPFRVNLDNFPGGFENLHHITLMPTYISSLNFLKFTPNLSNLLVKFDQMRPFCRIIGNTDYDRMGHLQLTKLKTLELNFDEPSLSNDDFQRLMELTPNVKKLKMPLDNRLFELVCQRWEKLESLEVVRGGVDSFGLTGLEGCPLFVIRRKTGPCIPILTAQSVPKANITYLKNLRSLSMEGPHAYGRYKSECPITLSHWAAHLGVERLPHLEHLRLYNYNLETVCGVWNRLLERYPWPKHGTQW